MTPDMIAFRDRLDAWRALTEEQRTAWFDANPPEAVDSPDPRLAMVADLCPSGTGPCGCGSGPPRICSRPDRPLEVRRSDCLRCVALDAWEGGSDPAL